jgi:RNA polymerase-binding transcription factor DksA
MTEKKLDKYRNQLRSMAARVIGDTAALEEHARTATGGDAAGNLSNAPMHLADLGTEVYMQELNSTLLQNEEHIRDEVVAALRRLDNGNYGQCENCGKKIPDARLNVLPYTRFCTSCAEALESGAEVNFNAGRPQPGTSQSIAPGDVTTSRAGFGGSDDEIPLTDLTEEEEGEPADIHAAGTPGGGTAVGGLAGTNTGEGDPADADLENAMGSGNFDVGLEDDDEETSAYAGSAGGAVGGTPAGKRAVGGKRRGGVTPRPGRGESAVGQ